MAKLYERINLPYNFCRLFGLGFQFSVMKTTLIVDTLLLLINLSYSVYGFIHVTSFMQDKMSDLWDITTVMSVARQHVYLLTPPVMIIAWQMNKRALTDVVYRLDHIVPSIENISLTPLSWYSAIWLFMRISVESIGYSSFHIKTNFEFFSFGDYAMIVVYNIWSSVPILLYVFFIRLICMGIRNINDKLTTIEAWKTRKSEWKELRHVAVNLTKCEFGVIIITFVIFTIAEIVFFCFSVYLVASNSNGQRKAEIIFLTLNTLVHSSRMFNIFRESQNCKLEMMKTQRVLNSVNIKTESDHKELKYTSLYMLHTDFTFMPCSVFEMNYRNLLTITTLTSAFVVFQIQMKLQ